MLRIALSNEPGDNRFDLIEIVAPPGKKPEKATTEHQGLEVAELRELLFRDAVEDRFGIDFFLLHYIRDRVGRQVAFDSLSIKILLETPLGRSRCEDFGARVLLRVFRVVQKPVIDKAADHAFRVRRRVLLLDQFSVERARRVRAR
jgi:hypothetical protein